MSRLGLPAHAFRLIRRMRLTNGHGQRPSEFCYLKFLVGTSVSNTPEQRPVKLDIKCHFRPEV